MYVVSVDWRQLEHVSKYMASGREVADVLKSLVNAKGGCVRADLSCFNGWE